jgi:hypothetical protein
VTCALSSPKDQLEIDGILDNTPVYQHRRLLHSFVLAVYCSGPQNMRTGVSTCGGSDTVGLAECAELPLKLWLAGSSTLLGIIPIGSRYRSGRSSTIADLKIRRS